MRHRLLSWITVVVASGSLSACVSGTSASPSSVAPSTIAVPYPTDATTSTVPPTTLPDAQPTIDATFADLHRFWRAELTSEYDRQFDPPPSTLVFNSTSRMPRCAGVIPYLWMSRNAYYCPEEDLIGWDEAALVPYLVRRFGLPTFAVILAHEMGHSIEKRLDIPGKDITGELQADCYAGAWARQAPQLVPKDQLDRVLAGLIAVRDHIGTPGENNGAHGSGLDRISAFQDGYDAGSKRCTSYQETPPELLDIPYASAVALQMDRPRTFEVVLPAAKASLEAAWSTRGEAVVPDEELGVDDAYLRSLHAEIGDFAAPTVVALRWSAALQRRRGEAVDTVDAVRATSCQTGAWLAAMLAATKTGQPVAGLDIRPGDMDEAVETFLEMRTGVAGLDAFDHIDALRRGVREGLAACG